MTQQPHMRTILAPTSQTRREAGLLHTLATPGLTSCISPSTRSHFFRSFAWSYATESAKPFSTIRPLTALIAEARTIEHKGRSAFWLRRRPYRTALQMGVPIERQFSPYFPCLPSVTRLGADPAPCGTAGSAFSGLLPQPDALGPRSRKCTLGTWERGTSRRFAQECPEGNPGKYKQEK